MIGKVSQPIPTSIDGVVYEVDQMSNTPLSILAKLNSNLPMNSSHPLGILKELIYRQMPGFEPVEFPSAIVTPAQNFDELGFPADHPGRRRGDSYYLNSSYMLRTHTSAHEIETFGKGKERWLLAADVYRRDEIDASHFPVFHQVSHMTRIALGIKEYVSHTAEISPARSDGGSLRATSLCH